METDAVIENKTHLVHRVSWSQLIVWLITLLFMAGVAYERFATKEYVVGTVDTTMERHKAEQKEDFKDLNSRLDRLEAKVDKLLEKGGK